MKEKLPSWRFQHLKRSVRPWQLMLLLLLSNSGFAQFRLVEDINQTNAPGYSEFSQLEDLNGTLYYVSGGHELWKTDGTEAGSVMVKSFASVSLLVTLNGALYMVADDGTTGAEVWKSDGTEEGTQLLKDIWSGSGSSDPNSFLYVNGLVYFIAKDGNTGEEVWKTDGTPAGTQRLKDIMKGMGHSKPSNLVNFNDKLFFVANNGATGYELWESDGTEAGTQIVKDIYPGKTSGAPNRLTVSGGILYFDARDEFLGQELWRSDGTAAGTVLLKDIRTGAAGSFPRFIFDYDGTLFLVASDGVNGYAFWKSDGTTGGTVLIEGLAELVNGGPDWIWRRAMETLNGKLYFQSGRYIYSTDGTTEGTEEIADTEFYYEGVELVEFEGALYYVNSGYELWKIDGSGSSLILDVDPDIGTGNGTVWNSLTISDDELYFLAPNTAEETFSLWKSDGTTGGTVKVKDSETATASSAPSHMTGFNGSLYFGAMEGLWKSDGTEAGTEEIADITVSEMLSTGSALYIAKLYGGLWKSDGTAAGTVLLKSDVGPRRLTDVNGTIMFNGITAALGEELWKSDGTATGTVMVKDIWPGSQSSFPGLLGSANGLLFFSASDGVNGHELWKSDGTGAGTMLIKNVVPAGGSFHINQAVSFNEQLVFVANDAVNGYELWKSDGTAEGTVIIKDIRSGDTNIQDSRVLDISDLIVAGGFLYFTAIDEANGWALWRSDGTNAGTVKVKDFYNGYEHIYLLKALGNEMLVLVSDAAYNNFALWKTNGTTAGTVKVKSFGFMDYQRLVDSEVMNGAVYFNIEGRVVWRTDGTECGTYTIGYEDPYNFISQPYNLTAVGSTLFFAGNANDIGYELFKLDESDVPPAPCLSVRSSEASAARESQGEEMSFMDMTVSHYPNPFRGDFTLRIDGPDDGSYQASLIQMNGMMAEEHSGLKCNTGYLLGSGLTNGIYILKVKMNDRIQTRRVVKIN